METSEEEGVLKCRDRYSWKYIEDSIRNGQLQDLEEYKCGPAPGIVRSAGQTDRAGRSARTPFSKEDDCIIWDWAQPMLLQGGPDTGQILFKELEKVVSWEDAADKLCIANSWVESQAYVAVIS